MIHQAFEVAGTIFFIIGSLTMIEFWLSDYRAQKKRKQWVEERMERDATTKEK